MECTEGGFRRGEINSQNDVAVEHFSVEDLFVDDDDELSETGTGDKHGDETGDKTPCSLSVSLELKTEQIKQEKSYSFSPAVDDFGSVPADDVADLEWLSHFMEDSFPGYLMTCHPQKLPDKVATNCTEPVRDQTCYTNLFQTKTCTKRARTGIRVWSESSPKQKKKVSTSAVGPASLPRRCKHCGVQKTPQWRAGPHGAKTLCNACGVRFKSGRLFPEYRPACSPTFSSERHSNSHRKVLEMRSKKVADMDGRMEDSEGISS